LASQALRIRPADRRRIWVAICVVILLVTHAVLAVHTISVKTVTVDEVAHLPAGISYWQKGSFALYHHNPPLVKLLVALPALAQHPSVPYDKYRTQSHFDFGFDFMYANASRYQRIYFWPRCVVVLFSLFAGWLVFRWGREIFGVESGLLALALWCFSPNLLAHAGVVTMDMGLTACFVLASYLFWRYLREPGPLRAASCGAALGLALLVKFIAALLVPIWAVTLVALWCSRLHPRLRARVRSVPTGLTAAAQGLLLVATALVVVNAGYGFEGTGRRLGSFRFESSELRGEAGTDPARYAASSVGDNRFEGSWLGALPVPLPEHFVLGFDSTRRHSEGGYYAYLCGEWRRGGWRKYHLVTLLLKVPLGTWLLTVLALAAILVAPRFRADPVSEAALLMPPAVVLGSVSLLTDINLGLRYVLPVLPFWFLWISRLGRGASSGQWLRWVVAGAVLWNLLCVVRIHPNHLAYFNEIAGGPDAGDRYLLDSNLDWGQDLHALSTWLQRHRPGEPVGLAYFGGVDAAILRDQGRGFPFRLAPIADPGALQLMSAAPGGRLAAFLSETWREMREGSRPLPPALASMPRARLPQRPPAALLIGEAGFRAEMQQRLGIAVGPQPGLYAISANFVHGYPYRVRDGEGNLWFAAAKTFGYFADLVPIAKAGYSIFIYDLKLEDANRLRSSLGLPRLPR